MAGTKKVVAKKATITSKTKTVRSEKKNASMFADYFRFGESYTSLILGIIVVIIASLLLVNLLRTRTDTVSIQKDTSSISTTESKNDDSQLDEESVNNEGQKTYTVKSGDDLWKIAESEYKDGFKWVEIAKANNISNPGLITQDTKLIIPNLEKIENANMEKISEPTVVASSEVKLSITPAQTDKPQVANDEKIPGNNYKVAQGDYLWEIAERAYGDGFKWVEIARVNKLSNPDLIYSGTTLMLPR